MLASLNKCFPGFFVTLQCFFKLVDLRADSFSERLHADIERQGTTNFIYSSGLLVAPRNMDLDGLSIHMQMFRVEAVCQPVS